jgi:preprotein translocase subunit SecF
MAFRLRLFKDDTHIDFMGFHKTGLFLAALVVVSTCFFMATRGLNFGIDFTGGILMEVRVPADTKVEDVRAQLGNLTAGRPSIQEFGEDTLMIKIPGREADTDTQKQIYAEVSAALGDKAEFRRTEYVGPQVGKELIMTGIKAFLYSMIGIMLYIWARYEWQFGIAGVASLAHDVIATVLFFVLTGIEFDLSTVAAILLVAGYSVNDTVIVFDRIREKMRKFRKMPLADVINLAVNQTMSRTLLTSSTTLVVMSILAIFGGAAIQGFIYAMILGIIIGTFSSIYVAAPLLLYMHVRTETLVTDNDGEAETPVIEKA